MAAITRKSKRVLSVFSLVMINIIAIDSLRNLPANAKTGFTIAFFYFIGTIFFMIPLALISAELATHRPKAGGAYVWVREAFGEQWGFLSIWLQWIYNVVWYPTILSFIAVNIAYLINPSLASNKFYLISMIIIMFSMGTLLNFFGMKLSALASDISAIFGTILPMLFITVLGCIWIFKGNTLAIDPSISNFFPSFNHLNDFAFLVVILFSLMGLEMSGVHAEEVKNPEKDYPRALLYSSVIIVLSLMLSSIAISIVIPSSQLNIMSGLDQAFSTLLNSFGIHWLQRIIIVLMILGGFGGMAAWIIGPTKGMMVAAQDGCMPSLMRKTNKNNVPITILIIQWGVVVILCSLFVFFKFMSTAYWILSDLTSQLALLFYISFFAAAIKLRYNTPFNPKAYRIPGGNIGIWLVGIIGIFSCVGAILLGFLPPDGVGIDRVGIYEMILISGIIVFSLPPFIINLMMRKNIVRTKYVCHSE